MIICHITKKSTKKQSLTGKNEFMSKEFRRKGGSTEKLLNSLTP